MPIESGPLVLSYQFWMNFRTQPLAARITSQSFLMKAGLSGLKYPYNVHGNIHAEKHIHLKIPEWTSMVHGHSMDTSIFIRVFEYMNFSAWILHGH